MAAECNGDEEASEATAVDAAVGDKTTVALLGSFADERCYRYEHGGMSKKNVVEGRIDL